MSLRAKIEAVVYAAEEPVTLAQLAGLFAQEALESKRVREDSVDLAEESPVLVAEQVPIPAEVDVAVDAGPSLTQGETNPEPLEEVHPAEAVEPPAVPEVPATSAELEAKRAARQRDREVREILRGLLDELIEEYARSDRGIEIREIAGGYRIGTKPEYHDSVRSFVKSLKPPMKLSLQALETLAVIAYKQPVTAPEVSEIRGVDSSGVLGSLISRKLITTAGRKQVIGRPILYKTTKEFLLRFGLKDVNELPSIEEFEKMAGELADSEIAAEPQNSAGTSEELPFHEADASADATEEHVPAGDGTETELAAQSEAGTPEAAHHAAPGATTEAAPDPGPEGITQQRVAETSHPVLRTVPAEED